MATKNELDNRLALLEESLMQTSRGLHSEINSVVELLAKTRNDLDRLRADVERVRNTVDTLKNLTANYDIKTNSW